MNKTLITSIYIAFLLISSLLSTIIIENFFFIHEIPYIVLTFGICYLILILLFIIYQKKKELNVKLNIPDLLALILAIIILISYLLSSKYNIISDKVLLYSILFFTYILIRFSFYDFNIKIIYILYVIVIVGSIEAIHGILQIAGLLPNLFSYNFGGAFGNPGALANLLVITYTTSVGLYFYEVTKIKKYLFLSSALIHLVLLILTFSRTAWIAGIFTTILVIYHFRYSQIKFKEYCSLKKSVLQKGIIFSFILFIVLVGAYKLYCVKESSANGRVFIWSLTMDLIKEKPVLGHGYNSFLTSLRNTQMNYFQKNPDDIENAWLAGESVFAFNDYIQLAVEYGGLTLLFFLSIICSLFQFRNSFFTENEKKILYICRVSFFALLISMLFSYPFQNPTTLLCFFILFASISIFDKSYIIEFKIKKNPVFIICMSLIILFNVMIYNAFKTINYGLKWKQVYAKSVKCPKDCLKEYNNLYFILKHDISFVMNYGSLLYRAGEYNKCINYFEKNGYLCISSEMYEMLGKSYEEVNNYKKAEVNYINASNIMPQRFLPKYLLFKLYVKAKQNNKAYNIALKIRNQRIKIFSEKVREIKTEINEYFLNQVKLSNELSNITEN
jgi:O-antigen ligase